ncbi:unnamed protein product [Rotaria socialis]|uniref:Uncharacterized protein n=1 Tax=Rotaria socialis TaxID=392032 RepID=A0A821RKA2_9BILA|nr:unnamed protein product [Rotaria socialis]CAF4842942.1 unnamed protein product [Rotaria socialis]
MWAWVSHSTIDLSSHANYLVKKFNTTTKRNAQIYGPEKLRNYVSSQQWRFHAKEEEAVIMDNVNRIKQILYAPLVEILPKELMAQLIDWENSVTHMKFPEGILEHNGLDMQEMFIWENMRILFKKAREYGQHGNLLRAPNLEDTTDGNSIPLAVIPANTKTTNFSKTKGLLLEEWKMCIIVLLSAWFCFSLGCILGNRQI